MNNQRDPSADFWLGVINAGVLSSTFWLITWWTLFP
jgi:hypothetical protein